MLLVGDVMLIGCVVAGELDAGADGNKSVQPPTRSQSGNLLSSALRPQSGQMLMGDKVHITMANKRPGEPMHTIASLCYGQQWPTPLLSTSPQSSHSRHHLKWAGGKAFST